MKLHTKQFGILDYDPDYIITFPEGIIGFEEYKQFVLIHNTDAEPFRWLVSLDDAEIIFPLLEASIVVPDYYQYIRSDEKTTAFLIATIREPIEESSVNLKSPLLIQQTTQQGQQVILDTDALVIHYQFIHTPQEQTQ